MQMSCNLCTAIFYTCGTCNLKCRYCGIHKNPILGKIDEALAESFKGDYYFNCVKKWFPNKWQLENFETWGGEPFIHMERLHPTLRKLIEYYPFLNHGFSSTNFSYDGWDDKVLDLMKVFGEYPERNFEYLLQLSVDGPEEINDAGRGQGVTKRCLANFNKILSRIANDELPSNVELRFTIKGTLDDATMRLLDTKEKIIEYYKFFEDNFIDPVKELGKKNVNIDLCVPNTAVPSPVTVEDGKFFAQLVKMCREIEEENRQNQIFKYYTTITIFDSDVIQTNLNYHYGYHTCGTGDCHVGFLPDGMTSSCHEGFTEVVEEYEKIAAQDTGENSTINFTKFMDQRAIHMRTNEQQQLMHQYKMAMYNRDNATARLSTNTALIIALALAGEVEPCFIHEENALKGALFIQSKTAYCIKDNYNITGSYALPPVGLYKLLLNGAMQYIQRDEELHVTENNDYAE